MNSEYYRVGRKQLGLLSCIRDIAISRFLLPKSIITKWLVPYTPDYIFLTHPRNWADVQSTFPFLRFLGTFLPKRALKFLLALAPCYMVARVSGPGPKRGFVISVVDLPDELFSSRELTKKRVEECIHFFEKICTRRAFVGLAAWWPIISNSGQLFLDQMPKNSLITVTNGHMATLASLYLTFIDIAGMSGQPVSSASALIIGVGKVGGGLAELLAPHVKKIGLVDKNKFRVAALKGQLLKIKPTLEIEGVVLSDKTGESDLGQRIATYRVAICTTSNTELIIKDTKYLHNCIIIDDSRPEAFPRFFSKEKKILVLEGGLMKIPGVTLDSDFGFGTEENIFGCLSEAIVLSLDKDGMLKPSIGTLDHEAFFKLIEFCKANGIQRGDLKCGLTKISDNDMLSYIT